MATLAQLEQMIDNAKTADDLRALLVHIEGASGAEIRSLTKRLNARATDLKVKVQADPNELISAPSAESGEIAQAASESRASRRSSS